MPRVQLFRLHPRALSMVAHTLCKTQISTHTLYSHLPDLMVNKYDHGFI